MTREDVFEDVSIHMTAVGCIRGAWTDRMEGDEDRHAGVPPLELSEGVDELVLVVVKSVLVVYVHYLGVQGSRFNGKPLTVSDPGWRNSRPRDIVC